MSNTDGGGPPSPPLSLPRRLWAATAAPPHATPS